MAPEPDRSAEAEILLHAWPISASDLEELVKAMPGLRWVHSTDTGVDEPVQVIAGRGVFLTSAGSMVSEVVAEHAFAVLMALARGLPEHFIATREREWATPPAQSLSGVTVLIVGRGRVGRQAVRHAAHFGCAVIGVRMDTGGELPAGVSEFNSLEQVHPRLGDADFVVLALPLTPKTRGLADARFRSAMQPSAPLVNVDRRDCVVEGDLAVAIMQGRPRATCLDVTEVQPLPTASQPCDAPGVWLTHFSAFRTAAGRHLKDALQVFLENLECFVTGRPLRNLVDPERGY